MRGCCYRWRAEVYLGLPLPRRYALPPVSLLLPPSLAHGEDDVYLKRGKALFLDQGRYNRLSRLWWQCRLLSESLTGWLLDARQF